MCDDEEEVVQNSCEVCRSLLPDNTEDTYCETCKTNGCLRLNEDMKKMRFLMSRIQTEKDKMEDEINDHLTDITYYKEQISNLQEVILNRDDSNAGLTPEIAQTLDLIQTKDTEIQQMKKHELYLTGVITERGIALTNATTQIRNLEAENKALRGFVDPEYGEPVIFELADEDVREEDGLLIVEVSKIATDNKMSDGDRISVNLETKKVTIIKKRKAKRIPEIPEEMRDGYDKKVTTKSRTEGKKKKVPRLA